MPSFEYKSLNKHLESRGQFLRLIANHILRTAQDSAEDGEIDIAAEEIPYDYDFLEDRGLIAEMLAERPEVAFVEAHNNGFNLRLRAQAQEAAAGGQRKALAQDELEAMHSSHKRWLLQEPGGQCADFSGMTLSGLDIRNMDFSGSNFSGAALRECDMCDGVFGGCDFSGTAFRTILAIDAIFKESNFAGAHLKNSNFFCAEFMGSDFTGAVFQGTNLGHANLDCGDFDGARFKNTDLSNASTVNAEGLSLITPARDPQGELEVAHARHTLWRFGEQGGEQADFSGSILAKLDFSGKNFDQALFRGAGLSYCELAGCSLAGAEFGGAVVQACGFNNASLQEASFAGALIHGCVFDGAELDGADFSQAEITDCQGLEDISSGPAMKM